MVVLFTAVNTNAQLLNKLKVKAAKTLEKKSAQKSSNTSDAEARETRETENNKEEK